MAIDFVSMYSSIMYSCGKPPESIDYIDLVNVLQQRFHSISYLAIYNVCSGVCIISLCIYGSKKCASNIDRTSFSHIITSEWEYNMPLSVSISEVDKQVKAFVHNMASRIHDKIPSTIYTTLIAGDVLNITHKKCPQLELGVVFNRCMDSHNSFVNVNPNTCIH